MKQLSPGSSGLSVPAIAAGCMRWNTLEPSAVNRLIHTALDCGICMFDHADIYGGGRSEEVFSEALRGDSSVSRDQIILQSKCGIRNGWYDSSKEHILSSVDGILRRLQTDYLDILLLHRPDALMEPEEVAEAFDTLFQSGKVRHFGVSNYRPSQIALLRSCVKQPLVFDQMQFSLPPTGWRPTCRRRVRQTGTAEFWTSAA